MCRCKRQRQGGLDLIKLLVSHSDQQRLAYYFGLPQISRLPDESRATRQIGKIMQIMPPEIVVNFSILVQFEEFAADFNRDDFRIRQFGRKAFGAIYEFFR